MLDTTQFDYISEYYEIEKTIEVVVEDNRTIRIEVLKFQRDGAVLYGNRAWSLESVNVERTYPETGRGVLGTERAWLKYEIAYVETGTADDTLLRSIAFLTGP